MLNHLHYIVRVFKTNFYPKKILNIVSLNLSYWLSAVGFFTKWRVSPLFISIEPVDACNLRCPECPVGMRQNMEKPVNIDFSLLKNLIDELSPKLTHAILYFQGEPLLNKNFSEIVKYIRSKNILTSTSTNAQLIDDDTAKNIVMSGLDRIVISIDGATQKTYAGYRVGGKLEKATLAVELLVKWKRKLKSLSPFIEIQFIVLKTNEHEMYAMKKLAKTLKADKLTFKTAQLYNFENGHTLLPENRKYTRYELRNDGKYHIKNPLHNRCKRLYTGAVVSSAGDVLPCCFDKDSTFVFGNLNESSFAESWHSDAANRFRKSILENRQQFEMCRNCTTP